MNRCHLVTVDTEGDRGMTNRNRSNNCIPEEDILDRDIVNLDILDRDIMNLDILDRDIVNMDILDRDICNYNT